MFATSKRAAFGAFSAVLALPSVGAVFAAPVAHADPPDPPPTFDQCVSRVSPTPLPLGAQPALTCFATFAEAMAFIGVSTPSSATAASVGLSAAASAAPYLAIFFENPDGTGASWVAWGTDCVGYSNLPSYIAGSVSGIRHGACSKVKHYSGSDLTGSFGYTNGLVGQLLPVPGVVNDNDLSVKWAP